MVGLSSMAIAKITSRFMVLTSDGQKHDLGLSLKFEAKSLKVIDYSKKDGRYWEFSDKAVQLIQDYKVRVLLIRGRLILTLCRTSSPRFSSVWTARAMVRENHTRLNLAYIFWDRNG